MLSLILGLLSASPLLMLRLSDSVNTFPKPLSASDEQKYVEMYLSGDNGARNILIEHNLRLVAHIIKKYYTQSGEQDDLISIGTIGLIKGISTYRPDKGVRLATYASRCIENEILMYFRSLKKSASDLSLSDAIDTDKDGNALSLIDTISTDEDLTERISTKEAYSQLIGYVKNTLSPREQQIISLRYGLFNQKPRTQRETAEICGISRSYVSRIEKKALQKLKNCFLRDDGIA